MVPSALVEVTTVPLSPNGKVDRLALPGPASDRTERDAAAPPGDAIEASLVALWSDVLDRTGIGINRWSSIDEDPGPLGSRNGFAGVGGWAGDQLGQHGLTTSPPAGCRSLSIHVHDQGITCSGGEMQG